MTPQIVQKLQGEISKGFRRESQVVYLLAGIRKILEQENRSSTFEYLKFHCNWALHARLDGSFAQKVLGYFDSEHSRLIAKKELTSQSEALRISKMETFREEISKFLKSYSIMDFSQDADKWTKFLYLYSCVIEDCPLIIRANNCIHIQEVVVSVEKAKELKNNQQLFKVSWLIKDKNEKEGVIFVLYGSNA